MKKRLLLLLLCAALLTAMVIIPTAPTASAMDMEGDWTTYRFANEYPDPDDPYDPSEMYYRPEAGYHYTTEGFSVIPADYRNTTPAMTVITKEKQEVKKGVYLTFRVDDFSYDGGNGADEWIALTLSTEDKVAPGSLQYGGSWMTLIRGEGHGDCKNQIYLTAPSTETSQGTFLPAGSHELSVPMDDRGREIYTLEVTWDGSVYGMKLNGAAVPGGEEATALLEKLDANGEFYVGIHMQAGVKDGTAALTILKYGTCEADATTPVGTDSKDVGPGCTLPAEPRPSDQVPRNQPAILWKPEANTSLSGHNCNPVTLGDRTWRIQATDSEAFMQFASKRSQNYLAQDFPVFGIMLRNYRGEDGGTLWYAAGEVTGPQNDCTMPFSIQDGKMLEDHATGMEYIFIPMDLTDFWEGTIHAIRLDWFLPDPENREFDICFAGMFRSVEEGLEYADEYLRPICTGGLPLVTEPSTETSVSDGEVENIPGYVTVAPETVEPALEGTADAVDKDRAVNEILSKYGCANTLGGGMLLMLVAACVALKKKN